MATTTGKFKTFKKKRPKDRMRIEVQMANCIRVGTYDELAGIDGMVWLDPDPEDAWVGITEVESFEVEEHPSFSWRKLKDQ